MYLEFVNITTMIYYHFGERCSYRLKSYTIILQIYRQRQVSVLAAIRNSFHGWIQRKWTGDPAPPPPLPLKNHKSLGLLSKSVPDHLKHHKVTKPAFNVGPSSVRQRNAILMAFSWWAEDGPLIVVFGWFLSLPPQIIKRCKSWTPSNKTSWICAWVNLLLLT